MGPRSKREYTEAVHLRYKNATRQGKTAILDEFCATIKCHRKHAIRVLKGFKRFTKPKAKRRGKPPVYQSEAIRTPLKEIWLNAIRIHGRRKFWTPPSHEKITLKICAFHTVFNKLAQRGMALISI